MNLQETALARQLEEANQKLASLSTTESELATLRTRLEQLERSSSLAQLDAKNSAQASEDRKARIRELESELAVVRESLGQVEAEKGRLAAEMSKTREELLAVQLENQRNADDLRALQGQLATTEENARSKEQELSELHRSLDSVRNRLSKKEAEAEMPDARDVTIASFERQVESIKRELAVITTAKAQAVQAALEEASGIWKERDLATQAKEEAERRVRDVEEMIELQAKRHEIAEENTAKENEAALAALQAEVERLKEDLAAKTNRVAQLERTIESLESLEARRKKYEADQRSGLDVLKSRMEDMRKSSTQSQSPRPILASASTTSIVPSSSSSVQPDSLPKQQQLVKEQQLQVKELQVRNGELLARVSDLQRAVDAGVDQRQQRAMEGRIAEQQSLIAETEAKAEDWKQVHTFSPVRGHVLFC